MRRTVSEDRIPEYPTVSVDSGELKDSFVDARERLNTRQPGEGLYSVRYRPPLFGGDVFERINSGGLTGVIEVDREDGGMVSEDFSIDYEANFSEGFRSAVERIESAVDESDFELGNWNIEGQYKGRNGAEVAESADGMALTPKMYLENDLDRYIHRLVP